MVPHPGKLAADHSLDSPRRRRELPIIITDLSDGVHVVEELQQRIVHLPLVYQLQPEVVACGSVRTEGPLGRVASSG